MATQAPETTNEKTIETPPSQTTATELQAMPDADHSAGGQQAAQTTAGEEPLGAMPEVASWQMYAAPAVELQRTGGGTSGSSGGSGAASGGGGGGAAVADPEMQSGTVQVDAQDVSKAKEIAKRYGTVSGDTIEMAQKQFQNYLNTLAQNAIEFDHDVPAEDLVRVRITAE